MSRVRRLIDTHQRLFPTAGMEDFGRSWELCQAAGDQRHGNMSVEAQEAEREAAHFQSQGIRIRPTTLMPAPCRQVSGIDCTVIVNPHGVCYAICVILDGLAHPASTLSRRARYNSGTRYVRATGTRRLAVVVSDDQTVDVIAEMRLRTQCSANAELEAAHADNYHVAIRWLSQHWFYLSQEQCDQVNAALKRIQYEPVKDNEFKIQWAKYSLHPISMTVIS